MYIVRNHVTGLLLVISVFLSFRQTLLLIAGFDCIGLTMFTMFMKSERLSTLVDKCLKILKCTIEMKQTIPIEGRNDY